MRACLFLIKNLKKILYAYHKNKNIICFLELYFKGDKPNEDRERIKEYLKNF